MVDIVPEVKPEKLVTAKFPAQQNTWVASDVKFSDSWVTITLTDGGEIHIYAQSVEYVEIS